MLAFIREAARTSHVELTALIVPGENDTEAEMRRLAAWVASVDRGIPLHVTRFFPRYRMRTGRRRLFRFCTGWRMPRGIARDGAGGQCVVPAGRAGAPAARQKAAGAGIL